MEKFVQKSAAMELEKIEKSVTIKTKKKMMDALLIAQSKIILFVSRDPKSVQLLFLIFAAVILYLL